jgi:hypothetical protein
MGRFGLRVQRLAVAIFSFWSISGCGGTHAGPPIYPGHINLTPAVNTSLTLGATLGFTASAQSASGTNINTPIAYSSSDTAILNLAPNGVACAGQWDLQFTTCSPGATGVVTVTASALGASSEPTYVFVHPPIDNITVTGILIDGVPIQEPCLSQSQSMTIEAHAYSQGVDITTSVGPFNFTANNTSVVNLIPLPNTTYNPATGKPYNFPTNEATARAANPGMTYIYASANGVSSTSFQQPQLTNTQGAISPILDFFETCPIQNIALTLGTAGSGQTSFVASKGSGGTETAIATVTDVMGNSSLPNTNGDIILRKVPLTWSASQPQSIGVASGCTLACSLTASTGSGTVTASCSPPLCNAGFPIVPASLSTPAQLAACSSYFNFNCQLLIPYPVYSSPVFVTSPNTQTPLTPNAAISGVVIGSTSAASVLAASTGCAGEPPSVCSSSLYYLSTAKASAGNENPTPAAPNSFLFDLYGDKVYMGSNFGAQIITPSNFGTSNNPYVSLGTVTGKILAISTSGNVSAFADNVHTPNQVYIVDAATASSSTATPLNIASASAAAFSPDGLKTFIFGLDPNGNPNLFVYSALQALQTIPLPAQTTVSSIVFSPNAAFAYAAEFSTSTSAANLTAYANCNNQQVASIALPNNPILQKVQPIMKVLPNVHIAGVDSSGNPIPDGVHVFLLDQTGFDVVTSTISPPASGNLCPQGLTFSPVQRIELGQGPLTPVNFFSSADGTLLYILSSSSSTILVYDIVAGSVSGGIELQGNATPLSADMSVDGGNIVVAGSDGMLHEVTTAFGGTDTIPLPFPSLPNFLNAFCNFTPSSGPCALTNVLAKP